MEDEIEMNANCGKQPSLSASVELVVHEHTKRHTPCQSVKIGIVWPCELAMGGTGNHDIECCLDNSSSDKSKMKYTTWNVN